MFYKMENLSVSLGPIFRKWGVQLFKSGMANQGSSAHADRIVPSLRCVPTSAGTYPKLLDVSLYINFLINMFQGDWIAPNATVIGDVQLGAGSSIWHSVIVRGDTASIKIGKNTTVQDLARIASNSAHAGDRVVIGDNVYIGPNASLDACTIEDNSFVGMGASVARGAKVEAFGVLAAGATLAEGQTVRSGQIFAGSPAHYLRDLTQEEKHLMSEHKLEMQQLSQIYCEETEKSFRE